MADDPDDRGAGAGKSLNKTITLIMEHLGDDEGRPKDGLRDFLHKKIGDLAERWFPERLQAGSYRELQILRSR